MPTQNNQKDLVKDLPKGWEIKTLGEVCDLYQPKTIAKKECNPSGNFLVYGANGVIGRYDKYNHKESEILMTCRGATCGEINFSEPLSWINGNAMVVHPKNEELIKQYLIYLLGAVDKSHIITGAAQPQITRQTLSPLNIPFPPLAQQKQIVATLDKAFAAIDKAKANAEQNLTNAKELFESTLQSVFENKGDDWEEKTLGEIAEVSYGFTGKAYEEGDYRYVRITDIDKNGELEQLNKKYLKFTEEAKKFILKYNDIVMARTGATFAKLLLFRESEPAVFASYLIRIDFFKDIENELYWYFSKSRIYWDQAERLSSGAAQPHFNGKALKCLIFSYPTSIKEQKALINKFRALESETKKLEAHYTQKIADLEELKKSLLQQAFSGQLNVLK